MENKIEIQNKSPGLEPNKGVLAFLLFPTRSCGHMAEAVPAVRRQLPSAAASSAPRTSSERGCVVFQGQSSTLSKGLPSSLRQGTAPRSSLEGWGSVAPPSLPSISLISDLLGGFQYLGAFQHLYAGLHWPSSCSLPRAAGTLGDQEILLCCLWL